MTPANAIAAKLAMGKTPPAATKCEGVETQVGSTKRCLKPKDSVRDCPDCPEMVVVTAGAFAMRSPTTEPERTGREDHVRVLISSAVRRWQVCDDIRMGCLRRRRWVQQLQA
jgi:formylglycine-generating enzyme required for sulfatase activity